MSLKRLTSLLLLLLAVPALGQTAPKKVVITWNDTLNPAGTTYNVYRAAAACSTNPTLTKINTAPVTVMTYTDSPGPGTYCYAATAVGPGGESIFSNQGPAVILALPNAITITVTVS